MRFPFGPRLLQGALAVSVAALTGLAPALAQQAEVPAAGQATHRPGEAAPERAPVRLDVARSGVRDIHRGLSVELYLDAAVPYRVFTLEAPRRLVIDLRGVDFQAASRRTLLNADRATDLRLGSLRPGWGRLVVDLAGPMAIRAAGMSVAPGDGTARLRVMLDEVDAARAAEAAGAPPDPGWDMLAGVDPSAPAPEDAPGPLVVAIDPGHGGVDPGAERDGLQEADLMLKLGQELAAAVAQAGMRPVLTRSADIFVPLEARMTIARVAGADVLLSLHADALERDLAEGASVYTLTQEATDAASARMAERHGRDDLLAGLDLSGQDDTVAQLLMDLARRETAPQADRLAAALVEGLGAAGARVNNRPRREAMLAVLTAPDFPSVLIEAGFLSNAEDRAKLATAAGRAPVVAGIVAALSAWAAEEAARAPLLRR